MVPLSEEATKKLSAEDQTSLVKIFQVYRKILLKPDNVVVSGAQYVASEGVDIPDGITPRLQALKDQC